MKQFTISQEMSTVSDLYAEINTFLNMRDSTKSTYVDVSISPNKIQSWINTVENLTKGIKTDADPA
jgi:hypothetical protein